MSADAKVKNKKLERRARACLGRYEIYDSLLNTLTQGMDDEPAKSEVQFVLKEMDRRADYWFRLASAAQKENNERTNL
jgi:hypothetical protein